MLRLFLENQELELKDDVQVAITKQFEDVTNPTTIINDWSKTISIPSTSKNDKIFGHIHNVDRLTVEGNHNLMGIYFDPYKKISFRLQYGNAVIMTGYAKNISIDKDGYNITLNGELGKVFQEMKKITFDSNTTDKKYLIDGSKYVEEEITKELIKTCFETPQTKLELQEKTNPEYKVTDIIGFAPNNSFVKDTFDYKSCEYKEYWSKLFVDELGELSSGEIENLFYNKTGIEPSGVIGDGLLPRQIGEYRSYLQLPFIYLNKLFQIFFNKVENITGYKTMLDPIWFSEDNPYWNNTVMMLSPFFEEKNFTDNITSSISSDRYHLGALLPDEKTGKAAVLANYGRWYTESGVDLLDSSNNLFLQNGVEYTFTVDMKNLEIRTIYGGSAKCNINPDQTFFVDLYFRNTRTQEVETIPLYAIMDTNCKLSYPSYETIRVDDITDVVEVNSYNWFKKTLSLPAVTRKKIFTLAGENSYYDVNLSVRQLDMNNNYRMYRFVYTSENGTTSFSNQNTTFTANYNDEHDSINIVWSEKLLRSKYIFNLNSLWDNEHNLFDCILNYCKQYRLLFNVDSKSNTISIIPNNTYFQNYSIVDWTDKVDFSNSYNITPITIENKYLSFNYKESELDILKEYKKKYGVGYGEYILETNYDFNTETKKLFENIQTSAVYTPTVLPYNKLLDCEIVYIIPTDIFVYSSNNDNSNVSTFGQFYLNCGIKDFDTSFGNVYITDDTDFQRNNKQYMYIRYDSEHRVQTTKYQYLDICFGQNLSVFGTPVLNYTIDNENYDNKNNIYLNFWKDYLDERYNKQNKIVTCYVYLKPQDYINFDWNKFVKINNQLYFVNKIYDYDIDSNIPTKVDLITIQNIEGYTKNEFRIFNIYYKNGDIYELWNDRIHYIDLDPHTSNTIYITSNTEVTWQTDQRLQQNVEVNGEVGYGRIQTGNKVPVTLFNDEYGLVEGYIEFSNGRDTQKIFVRVR